MYMLLLLLIINMNYSIEIASVSHWVTLLSFALVVVAITRDASNTAQHNQALTLFTRVQYSLACLGQRSSLNVSHSYSQNKFSCC